MKKFVNFRFVVTLVLAIFANVATYAQDNVCLLYTSSTGAFA